MPLLEGLRVVFSKIHGYGGVTTRPFAKGEIICFGDGVLFVPGVYDENRFGQTAHLAQTAKPIL